MYASHVPVSVKSRPTRYNSCGIFHQGDVLPSRETDVFKLVELI